MKSLRLPFSILGAVLFLYLFSYWIYNYSGAISSPTARRTIRPIYMPCIEINDAWQARRQSEQEKLEFFGEWEYSDDKKMSIKKNGQFTMQYGAQTIDGKGKFEEIDGVLYFIVKTKCELDNEAQSYNQLISDYRYTSPYDETCRIQISVFVADSPDEFCLASSVYITNLDETAQYGMASFGKITP